MAHRLSSTSSNNPKSSYHSVTRVLLDTLAKKLSKNARLKPRKIFFTASITFALYPILVSLQNLSFYELCKKSNQKTTKKFSFSLSADLFITISTNVYFLAIRNLYLQLHLIHYFFHSLTWVFFFLIFSSSFFSCYREKGITDKVSRKEDRNRQ